MKKEYKVLMLYLSIILCAISLLIIFVMSYALNAQKIILSDKLFADLSHNNKLEFTFGNLWNSRYNIILRLYKSSDIDYFDIVNGEIKSRLPYQINIELKDDTGSLLKKQSITQDSRIAYSSTMEYIEMQLLSFKAERGKLYKLETSFESKNNFFHEFLKGINQIYIEEDHDRAALPWSRLFRLIFMVIFSCAFLSSVFLIINLYLGKRKL